MGAGLVLVGGVMMMVARVGAAMGSPNAGWVMPVAVRTCSVPMMETKHSHQRQPGRAEGQCEGVGVHRGADPNEGE
jgi:hypothetical protein